MRKRWIIFTERQDAALATESKQRDLPVSAIVRELVREHYGLEPERVLPGVEYHSPPPVVSPPRAEEER